MSRVSRNLYDGSVVKLNGAPGTPSAVGLLDDATASVQDDVATIAVQVNLLIDACRAAGVLKDDDTNAVG